MVEKKLKQIAQKENGNYSINDYAISFTDGSRSPQSEYKIDFVYKDCRIYIIIQTGHVEFANIICELSSYIRPLDFKIDSTSPFENLFLRRSSRFNIECDNANFKSFLENDALTVFDDMMNTQNFNPTIFTENEGLRQKIKIEHHLAFPKWIESIDIINAFLKKVIDELKSDNRYISNADYRHKN